MKIECRMRIDFYSRNIETDYCNHTYLTVANGPSLGGRESSFSLPEMAVGDVVTFEIPSGTFTGQIDFHNSDFTDSDSHVTLQVAANGVWKGQEAGLLAGLAGFFNFSASISDDALVETSAFHFPVGWAVYQAAKKLARLLLPEANPQQFRNNLRDVLLYFTSRKASLE